jgi:hypothetical protein
LFPIPAAGLEPFFFGKREAGLFFHILPDSAVISATSILPFLLDRTQQAVRSARSIPGT